MSMTEKETDFWIQMFDRALSHNSSDDAADFADECLALLRKRTASVPQLDEQEEATADVAITNADDGNILQTYSWLAMDGDGDYFDSRTYDMVIMASCEFPGRWKSWKTPDAKCRGFELSDSIEEALGKVDWPAWDAGVTGSDE